MPGCMCQASSAKHRARTYGPDSATPLPGSPWTLDTRSLRCVLCLMRTTVVGPVQLQGLLQRTQRTGTGQPRSAWAPCAAPSR